MVLAPRSLRRPAALGCALVLSLSLAACGDGVGPGVAAEVDGDAIRVSEVDDLARVICATQSGQEAEGGKSPTSAVRALALNVLLGIRIGEITSRREVTIGGGHAGGHLGWIHVGLGAAAAAEVRVVWPGGETGAWLPVDGDSLAIVRRGATAIERWSPLAP